MALMSDLYLLLECCGQNICSRIISCNFRIDWKLINRNVTPKQCLKIDFSAQCEILINNCSDFFSTIVYGKFQPLFQTYIQLSNCMNLYSVKTCYNMKKKKLSSLYSCEKKKIEHLSDKAKNNGWKNLKHFLRVKQRRLHHFHR